MRNTTTASYYEATARRLTAAKARTPTPRSRKLAGSGVVTDDTKVRLPDVKISSKLEFELASIATSDVEMLPPVYPTADGEAISIANPYGCVGNDGVAPLSPNPAK